MIRILLVKSRKERISLVAPGGWSAVKSRAKRWFCPRERQPGVFGSVSVSETTASQIYATTLDRPWHHPPLLDRHDFRWVLCLQTGVQGHEVLFPGWQQAALVHAGRFECVGHVRHLRHHVAGLCDGHVWNERGLAAVGLAGGRP